MGAESAGKEKAPSLTLRPVLPPQDDLAKLLAARNAVCLSLEKSRQLGNLLDESNKRLQNVQQRLSPVRRALVPLQQQCVIAEELTQRIEKTLEPAQSVLRMFEVLKKIRVRLLRNPKDDFDAYLAALMQLEEALDYLKHNSSLAVKWLQEALTYLNETGSADTARLRRLNESMTALKAHKTGGSNELDGGLLVTALSKLEKEFMRLLSEHSQPIYLPEQVAPQEGTSPSSSSELNYLFSFPPEVLQKLQVIIGRLAGNAHYDRCIDAYQDIRGRICEESLQALDVSYMDNITPKSVSAIPWDDLQSMIQVWTQQIEVVVKMLYAGERRLARQVFKNVENSKTLWVEILCNLAEPEINAFIRFGESVAASERSPEKLCKLLEMFESMEKCEHSVLQVFEGQACGEIRRRYRELLKQVVYATGKTFWEIDDWVKEQRDGVSSDGRVMQLCSWLVNYLKYVLALFPKTLSKVLRIAQGWEEVQERGLAQGISQILQTLEGLVEARGAEIHDPALRHIFLMNNMYYIRNRVKNSDLEPLVGEDWISEVGKKVSQNALKYQREGWQRVLQHLNRQGLHISSSGRSGSRDMVRQRLKAFSAAFEETIQTQSSWIISERELRDGTLAAITQMVVPAYRSFMGHFGPLLEGGRSRDADKYMKFTPEMVESMIGDLFVGRN